MDSNLTRVQGKGVIALNKRSNAPVMFLVAGLLCLGFSMALPLLWLKIVLSVAGFAGLILGIVGIKRMK
jgi:surface polysaccharide O-acyltransferase-like enzyme